MREGLGSESRSVSAGQTIGERRPSPAKPFLKWAGGKGQALVELRKFIPELDGNHTYFEPFLGGGAVFFGLGPRTAILADLNRALVFTYQVVKDNVEPLIEALGTMGPPATEKEYYTARAKFNRLIARVSTLDKRQLVTFAALFIWLNHLCFNGLYRVNKKGGFNVPYGYYQNPGIYNADVLRASSSALKGSVIMTADYESALSTAQEGDLAYLDPPYDPVSETAKFTGYTSSGFGAEEQKRLAGVVRELVSRRCRVVLSNSPSDRIIDLYRGYRIERIKVPRAINCVGTRRSAVEELVIIA